MVHIKKVEIFGFKSFGFKNTVVDFEPGLVSISGPNGSGKSNILDAIIFAMGENRPKTMRVDKLRSLICDVDGSRRGPKLARASVHFENTDRGISVDSDTVEITREMSSDGDNEYFLNKKKANRGHILNLLNLANAGLYQLNAVQQGTVTRISEFTPEEKREAIENLVGLTDFDEKKAEAEKNLSAADTRLEVARAQMDVNKKIVDDLDEGRNTKLRHDMLGREIDRLGAISASRKLAKKKAEIEASKTELESSKKARIELEKTRDNLKSDIQSAKKIKDEFLSEVNSYNKTKAEIDTKLSDSLEKSEEANAAIKTAQKRITWIDNRILKIDGDVAEITRRESAQNSKLEGIHAEVERLDSSKANITSEVNGIDSDIAKVMNQQANVLKVKSQYDDKIYRMRKEHGTENAKLETLRAKEADAVQKIKRNSEKRTSHDDDSTALSASHERLGRLATNAKKSVSKISSTLSVLEEKKTKIQKDLEYLGVMLEKSSKAGHQYDTKIKMVKTMMHEDYSIAKLKEKSGELGILGMAYELVSWDEKYERAVLAASSDWIKATVVRDFAALVGLSEYVRSKKLPKLKIIPVEAIPRFKMKPPRQAGISGVLSDHVRCDRRYTALKEFLFGSILVADSKESAYTVSKAGYKAVTLDGEFFESEAKAVVIDIDSKISKLTKIITMSTSVEGLLASIKLLKGHVQNKKRNLRRVEAEIQTYQKRLQESEAGLAAAAQALGGFSSQMKAKVGLQAQFASRNKDLTATLDRLRSEIARQESHVESLVERISLTDENYSDGELKRIAGELETLNTKKSDIESRRAGILDEYMNAHTQMTSAAAAKSGMENDIRDLRDEAEELKSEKSDLSDDISKKSQDKKMHDEELEKLRQSEQDMISTSGTSVATLEEHDKKLEALNEQERELERKISGMTHREDIVSDNLKRSEAARDEIRRTLESLGEASASDINDDFEVEPLAGALEAERRAISSILNANAPAKYAEVSEGYRRISTRKNSLEGERNRIVKFIEDIEKEKKQTFLDAFDIVDKEIRHAFSQMTGGDAWLELQNEDDIFNSGISYMIHFKNKPKRESTSISGGEKTLAAVVFVLALQKLKPSPFYLFDEVDAHLDAPNAERLAKILAERSKESQFIMVSLKESVVQRAKLIYGVYPSNGTSRVVTYKDKRVPPVPQPKAKKQF